MIALQIAVGSRPPDLRYDVSGNGSVTSLDALVILQAAAGGAFNASGTPIRAAMDNATVGDSVCVWNGSYTDTVNADKPRLTLVSSIIEFVPA